MNVFQLPWSKFPTPTTGTTGVNVTSQVLGVNKYSSSFKIFIVIPEHLSNEHNFTANDYPNMFFKSLPDVYHIDGRSTKK